MALTSRDPDRDLVELSETSLDEITRLDNDYLDRHLARLIGPGCNMSDSLWQDNQFSAEWRGDD